MTRALRNISASVEKRLLNLSRQSGEDFQYVLILGRTRTNSRQSALTHQATVTIYRRPRIVGLPYQISGSIVIGLSVDTRH